MDLSTGLGLGSRRLSARSYLRVAIWACSRRHDTPSSSSSAVHPRRLSSVFRSRAFPWHAARHEVRVTMRRWTAPPPPPRSAVGTPRQLVDEIRESLAEILPASRARSLEKRWRSGNVSCQGIALTVADGYERGLGFIRDIFERDSGQLLLPSRRKAEDLPGDRELRPPASEWSAR